MTAAVRRFVGKCGACSAARYTAGELAGLFFAFSAAGWLWEVALHLLQDGVLVNRGTMLGPWLPVYGVGGVLAVVLLRRCAARPLRVFVWGALLCTAVEYAAGRYLLAVYGLRWWDYSRLPLNLDGLVSPLSSALFGVGCCAAQYTAAADRMLPPARRAAGARIMRAGVRTVRARPRLVGRQPAHRRRRDRAGVFRRRAHG